MQDLMTFISQHLALTYTLAGTLLLLMLVEFLRLKRNTFCINVPKAVQLINRENVIDIRNQDAFKNGHIIDAQALSAKEILDHSKKIEKFRTKPLILVCQTGQESQKIAALLLKQGYNVYSLSGGLRAWSEADLPLIKE
jgi:rhodanese-related sulfurtransferase